MVHYSRHYGRRVSREFYFNLHLILIYFFSPSEIDLLDWHNLLEINLGLAKLLQIPNLKV